MTRLHGSGMGVGMTLGRAAVVRMHGGLPLPPSMPERIIGLKATRQLDETPEVILVADDYRVALALSGALSWAKVIGIVAGKSEPDAPVPPFPAVLGVPQSLELIEDDMLLLLDAEQGLVFADPDLTIIAQYQAEHDHIAPKRRIYLDGSHLPARTLDNHTIQVIATVRSTDEVALALDEGADALYIPFNAPLLPANAEDEQIERNLERLIEQAAGKPLFLSDEYELPPSVVLQAATRADITLAVPPQEDLEGLGLMELSDELTMAEADCLEQELLCSLPRLAANYWTLESEGDPQQDTARIEALAARGATRLILSLEQGGGLLQDLLPRLSGMIAAANANMLPVFMRTCEFSFEDLSLETSVRHLVGVGVAGLLTDQVERAKDIIRELSLSECQEDVLEHLDAETSA